MPIAFSLSAVTPQACYNIPSRVPLRLKTYTVDILEHFLSVNYCYFRKTVVRSHEFFDCITGSDGHSSNLLYEPESVLINSEAH